MLDDYKGLDLKNEWLEHFGDAIPFPRDVGFPERIKAKSMTDFEKLVSRGFYTNNVYASVYSDIQIENNQYEKFFVDFDTNIGSLSNTLDEVWGDVRTFWRYMRDSYDLNGRMYFSGGGFHFYADFEMEVIRNLKALKIWIMKIADDLNIGSIDPAPLGDKSRIARLPFTWNLKSDYEYAKMCIPVKISWDMGEILERAESGVANGGIERDVGKLPNEVWECEEALSKIETSDEKDFKSYQFNEDKMALELGAIKSLTNHIENWKDREEPEDDTRFDGRSRMLSFLIVPRLICLGMSDLEIINWCRDWIERTGKPFDEYLRETKGYIRRTRRGSNEGEIWYPWGFERFFADPDHADIVRKFRMLHQAGVLNCDGEILNKVLNGGEK